MERIRWQYRVVNLGAFFAGERLVTALGSLGGDGWELVTIYDKSSNWIGGMEKGFALFKRPVGPDDPEPEAWADSFDPNATAVDDGLGRNPTNACRADDHQACKRKWCTCQCHGGPA